VAHRQLGDSFLDLRPGGLFVSLFEPTGFPGMPADAAEFGHHPKVVDGGIYPAFKLSFLAFGQRTGEVADDEP
jgi:hypothetical protein